MNQRKKRSYRSETRNQQAAQTRSRILASAKKLFQTEGFDRVTIDKLAQAAEVSAPTIYSLFQSKRGVLLALMDEAIPPAQFEALVTAAKKEKSPKKRLAISAKIARQIYDGEKALMGLFRGASVLSPEFKELEIEREKRRYKRLDETIKTMAQENSLANGLTVSKAHDILWAFTGRDIYRLFVVERGWSSEAYENWLAELLAKNLLENGR